MKKPVLVVNPKSGGGKTGKTFGAMRATIESRIGPCDVRETERSGHAIALAEEAARDGHPLVVAVGGDGTFNEVVNGLMRAKTAGHEAELGLIAQGTGGDFRRSLGIEHRLDVYLDALAGTKTRRIDVGLLEHDGGKTRYFVNILSAGMGGLVDQYVAEGSRAMGGGAAYYFASLKALVNAKVGHVRCKITRGGEVTERTVPTLMIAICNGRFFGSGMKVGPMAEIDDGIFEVVALGQTSKLGFAVTSNAIYSGGHMRDAGTVHMRGDTIEMSLENADASPHFLLDLDGEPLGGLPIKVTVVPKALALRVA
ncbi:MAG: diacylglycerol kinase family lipid kinase [Myxococcales bacterium]|nr:diacylglycerol kinase family lipid kinase [Myxococcales bacterium]